jgi:NAD(P)-dependent dehydrogenase (short-subunit alcohol dehydrogenase family)
VKLTGKAAIVTGAARGIGLGVATCSVSRFGRFGVDYRDRHHHRWRHDGPVLLTPMRQWSGGVAGDIREDHKGAMTCELPAHHPADTARRELRGFHIRPGHI